MKKPLAIKNGLLYTVDRVGEPPIFQGGSEMAKTLTKDLTQGSPTRLIVTFTLSMLLSSMMGYIYGTTDSLMVSHYVDPAALGAISAASPASSLIEGFACSTISGFSILAGRIFGSGDEKKLKNVMAHVVLLSLIFIGAATLICTVFCRQLVLLMQTPHGFVEMATDYLFILMCAIPISGISWICGGMFRALGDSKTPLLVGTVSGLSNVVFNALFLGPLNMGIQGAAYGTVCATALGSLLYVIFLFTRMKVLIFGKSDLYLSKRTVRTLLSNGLPLGLLNSVVSVGALILQIAINSHGENAVTGIALGGRVLSIFWMVFQNFESAIIYFSAQNLGAKRVDRIKRGIRNALIINLCAGAILTFVGNFFGKYIYMLFINANHAAFDEIISYAGLYLLTQTLFFPFMVTLCMWRGGLQGLGSTVPAVLCGVIELILRVVISVFFSKHLIVLFFAGPAAWVFASIFLAILYPRMLRRTERRIAAEGIDYYDRREEREKLKNA